MKTQPNKAFFLPLNDQYYSLDDDEQARNFFKKSTGIQDDVELKEHIMAVRTKAFAVGVFFVSVTVK